MRSRSKLGGGENKSRGNEYTFDVYKSGAEAPGLPTEEANGDTMANTLKYLNHLMQNAGITPACSEEEHQAAEQIAEVFRNHGFEPEIQEFNAATFPKLPSVVIGVLVFLGAVLFGIGGVLGVVGLLLCLVSVAWFFLERLGRLKGSFRGAIGLSQNVIAYHKASGPLASPRNRPVVVVAHYDSPRGDLLARPQLAPLRPWMVKLMPVACTAPAVLAVLNLFPFPGALHIMFWLLAIVCALLPLFNAVCILLNKYVLPYTSGSVCNKSSVAAMLGVMDAVAPYQGENEFPYDIPADQYAATYDQDSYYDQSADVQEAYVGGADAMGADAAAAYASAAGGAAAEPGATATMPAVGADGAADADGGATIAMDVRQILEAQREAAAASGEQARAAAEAAAQAAPATPEPAPSEPLSDFEGVVADGEDGEPAPETLREAVPSVVRHGEEVVRLLHMLPEDVELTYIYDEPAAEAPAVAATAPAAVEVPAPAGAEPAAALAAGAGVSVGAGHAAQGAPVDSAAPVAPAEPAGAGAHASAQTGAADAWQAGVSMAEAAAGAGIAATAQVSGAAAQVPAAAVPQVPAVPVDAHAAEALMQPAAGQGAPVSAVPTQDAAPYGAYQEPAPVTAAAPNQPVAAPAEPAQQSAPAAPYQVQEAVPVMPEPTFGATASVARAFDDDEPAAPAAQADDALMAVSAAKAAAQHVELIDEWGSADSATQPAEVDQPAVEPTTAPVAPTEPVSDQGTSTFSAIEDDQLAAAADAYSAAGEPEAAADDADGDGASRTAVWQADALAEADAADGAYVADPFAASTDAQAAAPGSTGMWSTGQFASADNTQQVPAMVDVPPVTAVSDAYRAYIDDEEDEVPDLSLQDYLGMLRAEPMESDIEVAEAVIEEVIEEPEPEPVEEEPAADAADSDQQVAAEQDTAFVEDGVLDDTTGFTNPYTETGEPAVDEASEFEADDALEDEGDLDAHDEAADQDSYEAVETWQDIEAIAPPLDNAYDEQDDDAYAPSAAASEDSVWDEDADAGDEAADAYDVAYDNYAEDDGMVDSEEAEDDSDAETGYGASASETDETDDTWADSAVDVNDGFYAEQDPAEAEVPEDAHNNAPEGAAFDNEAETDEPYEDTVAISEAVDDDQDAASAEAYEPETEPAAVSPEETFAAIQVPLAETLDETAESGDAVDATDSGAYADEPAQAQLFPADAPEAHQAPLEATRAFSTAQMRDAQDAAVDALMSQIDPREQRATSSAAPQRSGAAPAAQQSARAASPVSGVRRASLFDLPDPSLSPSDPLGTGSIPAVKQDPHTPSLSARVPNVGGAASQPHARAMSVPEVVTADPHAPAPTQAPEGTFEVMSAAEDPKPTEKTAKRRGLAARLFGRKKKEETSMSEWLGVGDDFDAKTSGREIGSWDKFEDDSSWKGGAAVLDDSMTGEEITDAVASLGDDELLGHDIWFVATGSSAHAGAGMQAFLDAHRDKLRGVFLINLECVGAGETSIVLREGTHKPLKGDRRISGLLNQVSADFHTPFSSVDMPFVETDACVAMNMSLRSITVAGVDPSGPRFACAGCDEDEPYNVDPKKVENVANVVTEVIRRS